MSRDDVLAVASLLDGYPPISPIQESVLTPFESIPMSGIRRAIASRLQTSKQQSPYFRLSVDLDLERLLAFRREINREVLGVKISVNDLLVKAYALALVAVPDVNIQFGEATQSIRHLADVDILMAAVPPDGLAIPIVRLVNRKSISDIPAEIHALVIRAKAGTLKPEEFQGGTSNVSDLGILGVRQFDAVTDPPQNAILATGTGEMRAVVRDGQIVACHQLTISLSCDHRVIDGAVGAAFPRELK